MSDPAQVLIVNTALFQLGQEPVTDLSEASLQGSVAATKLMRVVETARTTVLRRHLWLCNKSWATLPPAVLSEAPNWRYPTSFLAPGDCLRVWEIGGDPWSEALPGGWGPRWEVNTIDYQSAARVVIRASSSVCGQAGTLDSLQIAYGRNANWQALDAHVADAIAFDVAARGAWSVTGDRGVMLALEKTAEQKVMLAIGVDGTQDGGQPAAAPSIPAALRASSR